MFFVASKVLFFLLQPSSLGMLALAAGLSLQRSERRKRTGYRLAIAGLCWLAICGLLPVGNLLILPLEERFAKEIKAVPQGSIDGIIMLGGFEDGWVSSGRGGLAINEASERLTETVRLARRLPGARVIFTGGVGGLLPAADAGGPVRDYLLDAGISTERILIESRSRNTWENAIFTRDILHPKPDQRWLLVTSAYHMPRSVAVFRRAGFVVEPYPVDFRTRDTTDLFRPFDSVARGLERVDLAAKEWIGLVAYWLSGKTSELYPGPP